jgi:hypothetical protein
MNGRRPMSMPMQPDRRPQELARMLAMQERNSSLDSPVPQQPMRPSLAYARNERNGSAAARRTADWWHEAANGRRRTRVPVLPRHDYAAGRSLPRGL